MIDIVNKFKIYLSTTSNGDITHRKQHVADVNMFLFIVVSTSTANFQAVLNASVLKFYVQSTSVPNDQAFS